MRESERSLPPAFKLLLEGKNFRGPSVFNRSFKKKGTVFFFALGEYLFSLDMAKVISLREEKLYLNSLLRKNRVITIIILIAQPQC